MERKRNIIKSIKINEWKWALNLKFKKWTWKIIIRLWRKMVKCYIIIKWLLNINWNCIYRIIIKWKIKFIWKYLRLNSIIYKIIIIVN